MKKLIAISVVFALIAGVAFAVDIGVATYGGVKLLQGDTKEFINDKDEKAKPDPTVSGGEGRIRLSASGENEDGTFGGWLRYDAGSQGGTPSAFGKAWWKPIEQFKLSVGGNPDGEFNAEGITRWNFYQVAGDVGIAREHWDLSDSFYGGWGSGGLLLTLTPIEALGINIGIPYFDGSAGTKKDGAKDIYMKTNAQVAYDIDGIGRFALTYAGGTGKLEEAKDEDIVKKVLGAFDTDLKGLAKQWGETVNWDEEKEVADFTDKVLVGALMSGILQPTDQYDLGAASKLYLFFGLTAIENLEVDIGFGYTLPLKGDEDYKTKGITYNAPIAFGLGAHFTAGDFGVKARVQGKLAGKIAVEGSSDYKLPLNVVFDVMPYYAVNESLTAHLSAGVNYTAKSDNDIDKDGDYNKIGFHVNPYITIKSSWWAPNFYAGIDLRTNGTKYKDTLPNKDGSSAIQWAVPLGIAFEF
jgi:hypothetical protein